MAHCEVSIFWHAFFPTYVSHEKDSATWHRHRSDMVTGSHSLNYSYSSKEKEIIQEKDLFGNQAQWAQVAETLTVAIVQAEE